MVRKLLLIWLGCTLFSGCGQDVSEEIGYGELKGRAYTNPYFNMSVEFPDDWIIQSESYNKDLMEQGADLVAGDNEELKTVVKAAEKLSLPLFSVFKYEPGTPVEFNPNIICVAENVKNTPGIKTGADYFFHVKRLLKQSTLNYSFPKEYVNKNISGRSFDIMPLTINALGTVAKQDYYSCRIKDYVISFILSYQNDKEKKELLGIVSTMSF